MIGLRCAGLKARFPGLEDRGFHPKAPDFQSGERRL